ncbi:hypothetical protein ACHAXR_002380 [Thalassiosira sp. AJA248-18]
MHSSTKDMESRMEKRSTWANMSERRASLARLDSDASTSSQHEGSIFQTTLQDILNPSRLAALDAVDVAPVPYKTYSFFSYIMSIHGRNFPMLIAPLLALLLWGLGWQLSFVYGFKDQGTSQEFLSSMDDLITPLLTPLSFLLTFRLGRAAVRFWDARQAAGKMVEICRANIATVSVGFMSPIRLRKRKLHTAHAQTTSITMQKNQIAEKKDQTQPHNEKHDKDDAEALELLCEYARWLTVFPIAVKHFLRPATRKGWGKDARYKKRLYEIGVLLKEEDAHNVIMEYDGIDGKPTFDSTAGIRARDPPLVVLNKLHQLAYDISYFVYTVDDSRTSTLLPTPQGRAILYQQITDQLNILFGAYGAMERIKGTPLPFAYAIHLRTFLLLYLFLWNMSSVATYGWVSLPFLFLMNWALLGIEAAAVECERPFDYNPNHLTLGKVCVVVARNVAQALKELVGPRS